MNTGRRSVKETHAGRGDCFNSPMLRHEVTLPREGSAPAEVPPDELPADLVELLPNEDDESACPDCGEDTLFCCDCGFDFDPEESR